MLLFLLNNRKFTTKPSFFTQNIYDISYLTYVRTINFTKKNVKCLCMSEKMCNFARFIRTREGMKELTN